MHICAFLTGVNSGFIESIIVYLFVKNMKQINFPYVTRTIWDYYY